MDLSFRSRRNLVKARQHLPLQRIKKELTSVSSFFSRKKHAIVSFWQSLTTAQRCYFTATFLVIGLFWFDYDIQFSTLAWISWIIVIGLVIEFWPKFLHLWESLLGKTVVLIFYAIIANFALASSAGLVNEVAGVSADSLPYTHNWALILTAPTWFLVTNILALLFIQLLVPAYLVLLLVLKPFGIHGLWHSPDYRFVFSTALIRYVWVCILVAVIAVYGIRGGLITQSSPFIGDVLTGFMHGHEIKASNPENDGKGEGKGENVAAIETKDKTEDLGVSTKGIHTEEAQINSLADNKVASQNTENTEVLSNDEALDNVETNDPLLRDEFLYEATQNQSIVKAVFSKSVANFIYMYESDSYSRCEHPNDTRVVELNDYEILTIKKNTELDIGYEFAVIACRSPGINSK